METAPERRIRYYDMMRHWSKKIEPHLGDELLNKILVRDFHKYTWGRWRMPFKRGMVPHEFENCSWFTRHRRPRPRFWQYTMTGACHWLVNFSLRLAYLAEPRRTWRIITGEAHSTVWDGGDLLFEFNYLAFGIPAEECFRAAMTKGRVLASNEFLKVYCPPYYLTTNTRGTTS